MDRAEAQGLGIALAGHAALLAVLSLGLAGVKPPPILNEPMEVSFVEEVGLTSAAPSAEAPAPSIASELGAPEEAAPAPAEAQPLPEPEPEPLPPPPPAPRPVPKAVIPPPQPAAKTKPAPARPAAAAKPAPAKAAAPKPAAKPAPSKTAETPGKGEKQAARGSLLGKDFLKGIGGDTESATSQAPSGAVMSAVALAGIKSAIQRQIQPCANRQVNPGPGASDITVTLNLRLNRDGSLARRPSVVRTTGVDEANSRYEKRVTDLAIASYTGCAPLRGLPDELYQTAKGGWGNINMSYKLPG